MNDDAGQGDQPAVVTASEATRAQYWVLVRSGMYRLMLDARPTTPP